MLWLQIWLSFGSTTCTGSKFGLQVMSLALPMPLVPKLVIKWRQLHKLQIWPPGCVTCIVTLPGIARSVSVVFALRTSTGNLPLANDNVNPSCRSLQNKRTASKSDFRNKFHNKSALNIWHHPVKFAQMWNDIFVKSPSMLKSSSSVD